MYAALSCMIKDGVIVEVCFHLLQDDSLLFSPLGKLLPEARQAGGELHGRPVCQRPFKLPG